VKAGSVAAIALAVLVGASVVPAAGEVAERLGGAQETVRTGTSGNKSELVKTVPIAKHRGGKPVVVMSVQPGNLGTLHDGDLLEATAEVEVSVCLKPNELHGGDRGCIGRVYGYDPRVEAELVLGPPGATPGAGAVSLGRDALTCKQTLPNRNHHCVLVIHDGSTLVQDASALPCSEGDCRLNLALSASHRNAKRGHRLVVGSDADGESVNGDKGRINFTRLRPQHKKPDPIVSEAPVSTRLPIARQGGHPKERAIYSVELPNLRHGEQLVVDSKMVAKIGSNAYNAFQTTSLILSEERDSASRDGLPGRVSDLNGQVAEGNGFNCTQGDSAHENPCVARKVGVSEITRDAPQTLYLNLTAGMAAQFPGEKWRRGDRAKIADEGYLRVYRYPRAANDDPPPPKD
jgi:hypothetical protein